MNAPMTPTMTPPSFALPAHRATFADRLRPHRSQLLFGLILGLATESVDAALDPRPQPHT